MINHSPRGFFITASDTGVGKTWVGRQIVRQLASQVPSLRVRKPIESGCEQQANGILYPADGDSLFQENRCRETLETVTPYRFKAALAPDRAAMLENKRVTLQDLTRAVMHDVDDNDTLVVEGAGGFFSPIAHNTLNSDLATALNLNIIIVIPDRLGAINQALLTLNAVQQLALKPLAIVLNESVAQAAGGMDNLSDLNTRIDVPVYQCKYQGLLPDMDLFMS